MIENDLYNHVLLHPAHEHMADKLQIVSGFATANLVDKHLNDLKEIGTKTGVDLVVGMARTEGVPLAHHNGFCTLTKTYKDIFRCRYSLNTRPVHSKLYVWTCGGIPVAAWTGSANYTITGFGKGQRELLTEVDAPVALEYFYQIAKYSIDCTDSEIENDFRLYKEDTNSGQELPHVSLPLTSVQLNGEVQNRAGLNWGQRDNRDRNQAYIPVPSKIAKSDFFPPTGQQFTVLTDDNMSFVCVIAQDGRKALHTTLDNAILGRYFRGRIGLNSGELVTRKHLELYGRFNVTIYKIDEETYHMDFAPEREPS